MIKSWIRLSVAAGVSVAATLLLPVTAQAQPCSSHQSKWVAPDTNLSYGSMATLWVSSGTTVDPCGRLINTAHLFNSWAGGPYANAVEAGMEQDGGDGGRFHLFSEWTVSPHDPVPYHSLATLAPDQHIAFNVSNVSGTVAQFKFQYSLGTSQTNWITYGNYSDTLGYNHGTPLSEVERFGNTDGYISASSLQVRPSSGGWYGWAALHCSYVYANDLNDWDALARSSSSWYTTHQTPASGC